METTNFIEQAEAIVLENISNEQFGVSELAEAMHMSRSNLLRKIRKDTRLSASQFIRQVRLKKAMEILRQSSFTVSEVSYKVGFGSTSYFIKCFREYYGHPPGEAGKRSEEEKETTTPARLFPWKIVVPVVLLLVLVVAFLIVKKKRTMAIIEPEKSIAVLPFINESSDSSNVYFINGLMESTLNNLQKIEDLRVISRTSVEKYRNTNLTIPEIANELNVSYFVEGSGQKIGDQVVLNIQLIQAQGDKHIWAEQYHRKVGDIFDLQNEIAKNIADAIKAIVTPAELQQIEKKPTNDLQAYDYYLQAQDYYFTRTKDDDLKKAIQLLEKAIEHDPQFALAYAEIAICYYFLDIYKVDKQYVEEINNYADKALLYDSRLSESLLAKAFYYMHIDEYRLAVPHLEKALEYNPNSSAVVQTLADLYARYIPSTAKYLEYALKGIRLDIAANDSIQKSYIYLHLSNALIQTGFVDESVRYINKSLTYYPNNEYAPYLKAYIMYAKDQDLDRTKRLMISEWHKDTTRLDILQEVAKLSYYEENYDSAFYYYKKFVDGKRRYQIDIYPNEDIRIGDVYERMGRHKEAAEFFQAFDEYAEKEQSIYRSANMAAKYAHEGKTEQAIEQLKIFSEQDNIQYWVVLFMEKDPLIKPLKSHPDFAGVMKSIKDRFWSNHARLKKSLKDKELL